MFRHLCTIPLRCKNVQNARFTTKYLRGRLHDTSFIVCNPYRCINEYLLSQYSDKSLSTSHGLELARVKDLHSSTKAE